MSKTETINIALINDNGAMVGRSKAIWLMKLVSSDFPAHFAISHTIDREGEGSTARAISLTEGF